MGAFERKVGVAPAENVVEAATVASEDAPEAMSERGSAVGFVEISEKVSEGVERTLLVVTAAALDAAAVVDAAAADEVETHQRACLGLGARRRPLSRYQNQGTGSGSQTGNRELMPPVHFPTSPHPPQHPRTVHTQCTTTI